MNQNTSFEHIEEGAFYSLLEQYNDVVPEKLKELDEQRYHVIPDALMARAGDPHLLKDEVVTLVKWKLSHGKFRPTLQALVQRNEDDTMKELTRDTFKSFSNSKKSPDEAKQAVNSLSKLQGIGPATASLLLSVFAPEAVPFFSDELFRWCLFESGKGKGWDRDIKYNIKEYVELYGKVQSFRIKLKKSSGREVSAMEMEKVAYVLGKTARSGASAVNAKKRKAEAESHDTATKGPVAVPNDSKNKVDRKPDVKAARKKSNSRTPIPDTTDNDTAASTRPKRKKQ